MVLELLTMSAGHQNKNFKPLIMHHSLGTVIQDWSLGIAVFIITLMDNTQGTVAMEYDFPRLTTVTRQKINE